MNNSILTSNDFAGGDVVANQTSSIGNIGEIPQIASFARYKTFNNQLQTYTEFNDWYTKIQKFDLCKGERVTVRSFVKKADLAKFLETNLDTSLIEGIIDLQGCGEAKLEDYAIVYLGKNHPTRETAQRQALPSQISNAERIFASTNFSSHLKEESPEKPQNKHFLMKNGSIEGVSEEQLQIIHQQYIELLMTFGWDQTEAQQLVNTSTIDLILDLESNKQKVLAAGIAEIADIHVDGTVLKIVELTEAVVHPDARGLGLYHQITESQMKRVFAEGTHLVFGESNLDPLSQGVLYVAAKNGRQHANTWMYNGKRYELNNALVAHVPAGGSEHSNFLPTYITQERYLEFNAGNTGAEG